MPTPFVPIPAFPSVAVDVFRPNRVPAGVTHFCLTHGHSDHTAGLGPRWKAGVVVTSSPTAHFLRTVCGVPADRIRELNHTDPPLRLGDEGWVVAVESRHCHGSLMFCFLPHTPNVPAFLYAGEFRWWPGLIPHIRGLLRGEATPSTTSPRSWRLFPPPGEAADRHSGIYLDPQTGRDDGTVLVHHPSEAAAVSGSGVRTGEVFDTLRSHRIGVVLAHALLRYRPPHLRRPGQHLLVCCVTHRFDHPDLWGGLLSELPAEVVVRYADPTLLAGYACGCPWARPGDWHPCGDWTPPTALAGEEEAQPVVGPVFTVALIPPRGMEQRAWLRRAYRTGILEFLGSATTETRRARLGLDYDRAIVIRTAGWTGHHRGAGSSWNLLPGETGGGDAVAYGLRRRVFDGYEEWTVPVSGHPTQTEQAELVRRLRDDEAV